ncbi:hypothetical protein WJX73_005231 [Symbiochloris irregularis]|uniref:OTU domain-containing protein n=1 Tax=Symbiochloris irregularis TaxID=706552 RepID=A0AAW1NP40_9CHLO
MDVATVPFTIVSYSEPQQEVAREVGADAPESPSPHQPLPTPFEQLAHLRMSEEHPAALRRPPASWHGANRVQEGDSSEDEPDGAGGLHSHDSIMALELQKEEMRQLQQNGLSPDEMQMGLLPAPSRAEVQLNRRMSRRLSDVPTYLKHKPRVNSMDITAEALRSDREVLAERLHKYSLTEKVVKGDGNCQFRAVADQLYRTPHAHLELRRAVVARLRKHSKLYVEYVPEDYGAYCRNMERDGTWGDHVTLQAVADLYKLKIYVLTSFPGSDFIEIAPSDDQVSSARMLYVSFWAEVHYNSLYPATDPPNDEKWHKGKVMGSRRLHRLFRTPKPQT